MRRRTRFLGSLLQVRTFYSSGNSHTDNLPKMTLEDGEDKKTCKNNSNKMDIGTALRDALLLAQEQGRLTCGVYESGKLLEMNPDGVMLCILPDNVSNDVTLHIHFTLIEAFCWENDIRLIKVDSGEKLAKLLGEVQQPLSVNDNEISGGRQARTEDFNCILVEYPAEECCETEEDVLEFCKVTADLTPQPIVELAV